MDVYLGFCLFCCFSVEQNWRKKKGGQAWGRHAATVMVVSCPHHPPIFFSLPNTTHNLYYNFMIYKKINYPKSNNKKRESLGQPWSPAAPTILFFSPFPTTPTTSTVTSGFTRKSTIQNQKKKEKGKAWGGSHGRHRLLLSFFFLPCTTHKEIKELTKLIL